MGQYAEAEHILHFAVEKCAGEEFRRICPFVHYELGNLLLFFVSDRAQEARKHYSTATSLAATTCEKCKVVLPETSKAARTNCTVRLIEHWCSEYDVLCEPLHAPQIVFGASWSTAKRSSCSGWWNMESTESTDTDTSARNAFVAHLQNDVEPFYISGRDGVIYSTCRIFLGIHGKLTALHEQFSRLFALDATPASSGTIHVHNISKLIVLTQARSHSYFHALIEVFSRVALVMSSPLWAEPDRYILVHGGARSILQPFLRERILGDFESRLLTYDDTPRGSHVYRTEDILWPVWPASEQAIFSPPIQALSSLQHLLSGMKIFESKIDTECLAVIITRQNQRHHKRRMANFRGVVRVTNQILVNDIVSNRPAKVVQFDGEAATMKETINLFRTAKYAIGVHGGGLSNLIFMRPRAHLLEVIVKQEGIAQLYHNIATKVGINWHGIVDCDSTQGGGVAYDDAKVIVPLGALKLALQHARDMAMQEREEFLFA